MFDRTVFRRAALFIILAELLSLLTFVFPALTPWVFGLVSLAIFAATLYDLRLGVLIAIAELAIGGFGYLFVLPVSGINFSIRMAIFLIIFGVWISRKILFHLPEIPHFVLRAKSPPRPHSHSTWLRNPLLRGEEGWREFFFTPFVVLGIATLWGIARGIVNGNDPTNIFFDANSFAFLLLAPAFFETIHDRQRIREAVSVAFAAIVWLSFKTLIASFVFSHAMTQTAMLLYKFIRDTRVGEITPVGGDVFRFFFQSHVYLIPALLTIFAALVLHWKTPHPLPQAVDREARDRGRLIAVGSLFLAVFLLTFSRSFWIGAAIGFIFLIIFLFAHFRICRKPFRFSFRAGAHLFGSLALVAIFSFGILLTDINFPFPLKRSSSPLAALIANRVGSTDDAAASSRWALLPVMWLEIRRAPILGMGFGKTLTYITQDPRIRASNPTGEYTTFAFEWGWLDIWLKMGILGLAAFGYALYGVVRTGMGAITQSAKIKTQSSNADMISAFGLTFGSIALAVVHFFTPYLTHPLGLGYLIFVSAVLRVCSSNGETTRGLPHL